MKALRFVCFGLLFLFPVLGLAEKPCEKFLVELEKHAPSEVPPTIMQIMVHLDKAKTALDGIARLKRDLELDVDALEGQLSPEHINVRTENDPRWTRWLFGWLGLWSDEGNPYTLGLNEKLKETEKGLSRISEIIYLEEAVSDLRKIAPEVKSTKNLQILEWLSRRAENLLVDMYTKAQDDTTPLSSIKFDNEDFLQDRSDFTAHIEDGEEGINPLQEEYERYVRSTLLAAQSSIVENVLDRELDAHYVRQLKMASVRLGKELEEHAMFFEDIDDSISALYTEAGKRDSYVDDVVTVSLARTGVEYGVSADKLATLVLEIEDSAVGVYEGGLDDYAIGILVEVAVAYHVSPDSLVERVESILDNFDEEDSDEFDFSDMDLARLVRFSLRHKMTAEQTADTFRNTYGAADEIIEHFSLNNYVMVDLMNFVQQNEVESLEDVLKELVKLNERRALASAGSLELLDRDLLHLIRFSRIYDVPSIHLTDLFVSIYNLDSNLDDATILNILDIALKTKLAAGLLDTSADRVLTKAELLEVIERVRRANIPHFEWFYWTAKKEKEEAEEAATEGRHSSRTISPSYQYDNDYGDPHYLDDTSNVLSITQYAITGSLTNFDGNPFTAF